MCGIVGFVEMEARTDGGDATADLRAMVASLHHRGPDACGQWEDNLARVFLGHTRLSIIDLSPTGAQPMLTSDGQGVLVFNGEIYNFEELRVDLVAAGVSFVGRSDTEVLLQALYCWGPDRVLPRLNGMFAFAYWDARHRTLVLARDRMGEKPLYYAVLNGRLFFASELKALRAHSAFRAELNKHVLPQYFRYSYVPSPACIYRNVYKLPAAHWLSCDLTRRSVGNPVAYWNLAQTVDAGRARVSARSPVEWEAAVHDMLRRAVSMRLVSDRPVGCFLSGGIDSSAITALMQSLCSRPVRTFTVGYCEEGYNEATDAERVARHLGTEHTTFLVRSQEAMDMIPRLPDVFDEPFADASQVPTALLAQLTVSHVTVALSGDGGDEIFGGYNRHIWTHGFWDRLQMVPAGLRQIVGRAFRGIPPECWNVLLGRISRLGPRFLRMRIPGDTIHKMSVVAASANDAELYRRLTSLWQDPDTLCTGDSSPLPFELLAEPRAALASAERMMYWDAMTYLPDDVLAKLDRASMHVGLEGRIPFLDNELIALAWELPLVAKLDRGFGKQVLRRILAQYVPRDLWDRPKTGFGVPIGDWLRTSLRAWGEDLLAEPRLAEHVALAPVKKLWVRHLAGRVNAADQLWSVLMFSAWLRRWRM